MYSKEMELLAIFAFLILSRGFARDVEHQPHMAKGARRVGATRVDVDKLVLKTTPGFKHKQVEVKVKPERGNKTIENKLHAEVEQTVTRPKEAEALQKENTKQKAAQTVDEKESKEVDELEKVLTQEMLVVREEEMKEAKAAEKLKLSLKDRKEADSELAKVGKAEALQSSNKQTVGNKIPQITKTEEAPALYEETLAAESRSVRKCILNELPEELKIKIEETDDAEEKILADYAASRKPTPNSLHAYTSAKASERTLLKELLPELGSEADNILTAYKALRKGEPWSYVKLEVKYRDFFKQPSDALAQYQLMKTDEKDTLASSLSPSTKTHAAHSGSVVPKESETLERRPRAVGVEFVENSETAERGIDEIVTFQTAPETLGGNSSIYATIKTAGTRTITDSGHRMIFMILSVLIVLLVATIICVIACKKELANYRMRRKLTRVGNDREPLTGHRLWVQSAGSRRHGKFDPIVDSLVDH